MPHNQPAVEPDLNPPQDGEEDDGSTEGCHKEVILNLNPPLALTPPWLEHSDLALPAAREPGKGFLCLDCHMSS